ncbi:glyco_hydro_56 domain-containing protein isoform X2 [Dunckerocampus dactyliophorus]|uniref:glyco_hydro_56 domain-containing protein isoform X2 n=1 Tax=Dunckerocampus dactyliophorus TaxID=161453 RepID=UPI0024058944|nr:glyco_hydro_56 domain-containing protein isoform X2 [Dunckerocampus dactyliophorus]
MSDRLKLSASMAWSIPPLKPKVTLCKCRTKLSVTWCSTVPLSLLVLLLAGLSTAGPPQPARPPLLSGQPFIIFWAISDSSCATRPDPGSFGMEREGRVVVFYEDTLGNYPYFLDKDTRINGGLPQHTRLDNHLQKTQLDLDAGLPAPRYLGLGVLRWSAWLPQWLRNKEKKAVYQEASRNLLKAFFPNWTPEEVEKWSRVDFEAAAQSVIMETLREVKRLRPKALWGVSPYPSCYNGDAAQTAFANYTSQCPPAEKALNDELLWLWRRSSALYPLLSLEKLQGGTSGGRLYLSSEIQEALRVSSLAGAAFNLPVFPLVNSVYASTNTFLSQADLVSSIGESAAMGTAGVVIWQRTDTKTEAEAVKATSQPDPDAKAAEPDPAEIWKKDFQCQWYKTTDRDVSDQQSPKDGTSVGGMLEQISTDLRGTSATFTVDSITKGASVIKPSGSGSALTAANRYIILLLLVTACLTVD